MPRRDWLQGFADTAIREKHVVTFQFGNVEIVLTRRGKCKYRTRPRKSWKYDTTIQGKVAGH
jgi:hypothetical protein